MSKTESASPANMTPLFDELKAECLNATGLIEALAIPDLTRDQKEILIGKLSAAVTHLHIHTGLLERELDEI
jgi:hypothetical protein